MTKQSLLFKSTVIVTRIFLLAFIIAILWGTAWTVLSLYILFTNGLNAALPYFFAGIGLIVAGYLINVLLAFVLTKKWRWRLTTSYEFRQVPKQSKK